MGRRPSLSGACLLAASAACLLAAAGCGRAVPTFALKVSSVEPAEPIVLTGFKLAPNARDGVVVALGHTPMLFDYLADGTIVALTPLYLGNGSWPVVPTKPQLLRIFRNGKLIVQASSPLQVKPLAKAPGTTEQMAQSLDAIGDGFTQMSNEMPADFPIAQQVLTGLATVAHGAGTGGVNSVDAYVKGTAPLMNGQTVDVSLLDAVLASSGAAALMKNIAGGLKQIRVQSLPSIKLCFKNKADREVACMMQYQAWFQRVMNKLGEMIEHHETALKVLSLIGILFKPALMVVVLAEAVDILDVKLAPSALPSKISSFQLAITKPVVPPTALIDGPIMLKVTNVPASLSVGDLVKLIIGVIEAATPEAKAAESEAFTKDAVGVSWLQRTIANQVDSSKGLIMKTVSWALKQLDPILSANLWNQSVFTVPTTTWKFLIDPKSVDLVDLTEADSSVVQSLAKSTNYLQWGAVAPGSTTVQVKTVPPGKAPVLFGPPFDALPHSGSFGNATGASNAVTIVVPWGDVNYTVANHGTHQATGTVKPSPAGGSDGTAYQPNEVDAFMWGTRWSLAAKSADNSFLWIECGTPFSKLGANILFDIHSNAGCDMGWTDNTDSPTLSAGAITGEFSFDTCTVLANNGIRPTAVQFTGSYGATFQLVDLLNPKAPEKDSFSGKYDAVFILQDGVPAGSPDVLAIESQCKGWPPKP